jgi:hypothetical protein
MEGLTRLVSESFARHGFDRPLDYRRLHWSRWFPCDSPRSLLYDPSKPGVFALAEELMDFSATPVNVGTAALGCPPERSSPVGNVEAVKKNLACSDNREGHDFSRATSVPNDTAASAAEGFTEGNNRAGMIRRMLAVLQFCEDDDMAFVLDRMFSRQNPMRARLASGRCFVRFVVLEDPTQRRSICNALNQWLISSSEVSTGIGAHFATSLELAPATEYIPRADDAQQTLFDANNDARVGRTLPSATASATDTHVATGASQACPEPSRRVPRSEASGSGSELGFPASTSTPAAPQLDSGAAANIHCPSPFPSGF